MFIMSFREDNTISLTSFMSNRESYDDISNLYIVDSEISLSENEKMSENSESEDENAVTDKTLFDITATDKILEKYSQNAPTFRTKKLAPAIPSNVHMYYIFCSLFLQFVELMKKLKFQPKILDINCC